MSDIDSLELKIVLDKDIEKLERIKELLAEIQQLRDEVFGKQENDQERKFLFTRNVPAADFISSQEEKSEFSEM